MEKNSDDCLITELQVSLRNNRIINFPAAEIHYAENSFIRVVSVSRVSIVLRNENIHGRVHLKYELTPRT